MSGVKKNFLYNVSYQLLNIMLPLVTTPYLSRVLGPELVGTYSYTYSITNYFVLFATCGMSTYGVRAIARTMGNREERTKVFWSAFYSQLVLGVVVFAIYIAYVAVIHEGGIVLSAVWGMYAFSALIDVSWLLFGCSDFRVPTIRSAFVRIIQFLAVFVFVRDQNGLLAYISINSLGFLANQLLIWPFVHDYVDRYHPSWSEIKLHFIPNIRLFVPVIAVSLYTTLDKIMLGSMTNMTQTGYFEYAEKISRLPLTAITALGTVMLPTMSERIATGRRLEAIRLIKKSAWVMLAIAFAFAFGIIAVGDIFVPVYLGESFIDAIPLVLLLSAIIPIVSVTNIIGKQFMLPSLMDNQYTVSLLFGAGVNVVVNLLLIPHMQGLGAAIGTVAAESSVLVAQVIFVRRDLQVSAFARIVLPFFFIGLFMLVALRGITPHITAIFGYSVATLGVDVLIGAGIYMLLLIGYCLIFKDNTAAELFNRT